MDMYLKEYNMDIIKSGHTCNLVESKELKRLGVKQDSIWYWHKHRGKYYLSIWTGRGLFDYKERIMYSSCIDPDKDISALTVGELGDILPYSVIKDDTTLYLTVNKNENSWMVSYLSSIWCTKFIPDMISKTEISVKAATLIYLLKNEYLTFSRRINYIVFFGGVLSEQLELCKSTDRFTITTAWEVDGEKYSLYAKEIQ